MKIAVVGAGAIGGVVAWHLAAGGRHPLVVARPASAALITREGLILDGPDGPRTVACAATDDPLRAGPQDVVLVGYKAHDWAGGLPLLAPLIGSQTLIVPLLNGIPWWYLHGLDLPGSVRLPMLDPDGALEEAAPTRQLAGAVVYIGANRTAPNRIGWNGRKRLVLGGPDGTLSPPLLRLVDVLRAAGLDIETTSDIRAAIWQKLLGNASYNPVSAITGLTVDQLVADPGLYQVVRAIMLECVAVAGALGVHGLPDVDERLRIHPSMVGVKTSMLQDMEAGRPLELAALVEAVAELGRRHDVPTPMTAAAGAMAGAAWRSRWTSAAVQSGAADEGRPIRGA